MARALLATPAPTSCGRGDRVRRGAADRQASGKSEVEYVIGTGYGRYRVTFGNDAGHRDQLPRPRRRPDVPRNTAPSWTWAARTPRRSVVPRGRDRRLLHERQVRGGHRPLPGRCRGGARHPARRARPDSAARRADRCASARPAPCSPSPRCCPGSARARRSRTSCGACTSRSPADPPALMRRVGIEDEVTFTGGVARNVAMVEGARRAAGAEAQRQRGVALHGGPGRRAVRAGPHSRQPRSRGRRRQVQR